MSSKPLIQPFILHFFKITILIFSTHSSSGRSSPPLVSVYPTLFSNAFFHSLSFIPFIPYMLTSFTTANHLLPHSFHLISLFIFPYTFLHTFPTAAFLTRCFTHSIHFLNAFFLSLFHICFFTSTFFHNSIHLITLNKPLIILFSINLLCTPLKLYLFLYRPL